MGSGIAGRCRVVRVVARSREPSTVRLAAGLGFLVGLTAVVLLIAWQGAGAVAQAFAAAGWGLIVVVAYHLVPMSADMMGWRRVIRPADRPSIATMLRARWIGEAVNTLLPVARIGGEVAKARLIAQRGVPAPIAGASVVVDLSLSVLTQVVFTLCGLGLLVLALGANRVAVPGLIGAGLIALALSAFLLVQRRGLFMLLARVFERIAGERRWKIKGVSARSLDEAVLDLYRDRRAILGACAWRLLGWSLGAGEIWIGLRFMGHPVGLLEAVLLESLGEAVRAAAFVIPGALGALEGGYLAMAPVLGISPEAALALALVKRFRELTLGLVALGVWQASEGRSLLRRHKRAAKDASA